MKAIGPCTNCGSVDQRTTQTSAQWGGGGLLPGAGGWIIPAVLDVVVCCDCGLVRLFTSREAVETLVNSDHWRRI